MKKIHVVMLATILLLSTIGSAQQNAPARESKASAPPPGTVTGSGTANYVPLWTGSTVLGSSRIYQGSSGTGIGTTSPQYALDVDGHINSASGYLLEGSLVLTLPGSIGYGNLAVGPQAMETTTGEVNTAVGLSALFSNTSGSDNTAIGADTLESNTTGSDNSALGVTALRLNSIGAGNTAAGYEALYSNTTGSNNIALGYEALLQNTAGTNNIAIGYFASYNVYGASTNNIEIGSQGAYTDTNTIRIGTSGTQTSFFVAGVSGVQTGDNDAVPVLIDTNGQLGTVSSSRRFKEDIQDMGVASRDLMRLRPVTFRYKKPFADGSQPMQYGLIAEEVAEVYPDLVARSADGQIETVKYQLLDPMLLNEVQRQQAQIRELEGRLNKIESVLLQTTAGAQPK